MKSVRFAGSSRVDVIDVPDPAPRPGEVLLRVTMSAICGSDMGAYRGPEPTPDPVGHEMLGEVVEAAACGSLREGDRAAVYVLSGCGVCPACRSDNTPFCPQVGVITGGHSEYLAVPERNCIPIPDDIRDDVAVLMAADTLGVAWHLNTRVRVCAGERVLVCGTGPVGLGNVALLSCLGAEVVAVDMTEYRCRLAREMGAAETVCAPAAEALDTVMDLAEGRGYDVALDCAGAADTLNLALNAAGPAARVGFIGEKPEALFSPSAQFIRKELTAFGSWYFRLADPPRLFELYRKGLAADRMITHRFPLAEAQVAHAQFDSRESGKVVLTRP